MRVLCLNRVLRLRAAKRCGTPLRTLTPFRDLLIFREIRVHLCYPCTEAVSMTDPTLSGNLLQPQTESPARDAGRAGRTPIASAGRRACRRPRTPRLPAP